MHMAVAHRLICDHEIPIPLRDFVQAAWGAFLCGTIAPDARVSSGIARVNTHFFEYEPVVDPPAIAAMFKIYPALRYSALMAQSDHTNGVSHAAFIAGYVTHLAMDELWSIELLFPYFFAEWGTKQSRFLMLHMLLGYLDQRDRRTLPDSDYLALARATPHDWLPFIPDIDLSMWQDIIAKQLAPGAASQTLQILGQRIAMSGEQMAAFINDPVRMNDELWQNVPPEAVAKVEEDMYRAARLALVSYFNDKG